MVRKRDDDDMSDDDQDFEEEFAAEEAHNGRSSKGSKRKSAFIDDAAEESDSDDDDEDKGGGRRGKRQKRSRFIDDTAAVADEDEEEEEEGDDDFLAPEADEVPQNPDLYRPREPIRLPGDADMTTTEQLEDYVQRRFGDAAQGAEDLDDADAGGVSQQALLPTPNDPKLWLVECKGGSEREAIIILMQKAVDMHSQGKDLAIKSAFAHDHLAGFLYIEAHKEAHVMEAIRGLRIFRVSKGTKLVPLREMADALTVNAEARADLSPDAWVRVRTGLYKGDLAKVVDVDYSRDRATIQIIPRIDFAAMAKRQAEGGRAPPFGGVQAGKPRPPQKAFSVAEARQHRLFPTKPQGESSRRNVVMLGSQTFEDGYAIRDVAIKSLDVLEGAPPIDELQKFKEISQAARDDGGALSNVSELVATLASGSSVQPIFAKDDRVIVIEGDLQNLTGIVERVADNGSVMVRGDIPELAGQEAIPLKASQLSKFFQAGDSVTVTGGAHKGKKGVVVKVEGTMCHLYSAADNDDLQVFLRDCTDAAADVALGLDTLGDYSLHDLVVLDQQTVGVIISISADSCQVLTNKNQAMPGKPAITTARGADIKRKLTMKRGIQASDIASNAIDAGDIVTLTTPGQEGVEGTVKYIQRGALFLQSRARMAQPYGGFICVDSRKARLRGGKAAGAPRAGTSLMNVMRSPAPWQQRGTGGSGDAVTMASPRIHGAGGAPGLRTGGYQGPGFGSAQKAGQQGYSGIQQSRRQDNLINKNAVVARGPYKGYKGRVVSATETHVRMELEAQYRTVTILKEQLKEHGGAPSGYGGFGRSSYGGAPAFAEPAPGSQTPLPGGQTPHHLGGRTPIHPSMTPLHGGATPMHYSMAGGATPSRDASSAWSMGGMTPAHTPAEPAEHTASAAPTPALYDGQHPTPTPQSHGGTPFRAAVAGGRLGAYRQVATPAHEPSEAEAGLQSPEASSTQAAPSGALDWTLYQDVLVALPDGSSAEVTGVNAATGMLTLVKGVLDAERRFKPGASQEQHVLHGSAVQPLPVAVGETVRLLSTSGGYLGHCGTVDQQTDVDWIVKLPGSITFCPQQGGAARFADPHGLPAGAK